jgi:hypothetical protein
MLGEGLGGFGLGVGDTGAGDAADLVGAGGQGGQQGGGARLLVLEGFEFGGEGGLGLGDAFGGRLAGRSGALAVVPALARAAWAAVALASAAARDLAISALAASMALAASLRGAGFGLVQQGLAAGFQGPERGFALGLLGGGVGDRGGESHFTASLACALALASAFSAAAAALGLIEELLEAGDLLGGGGFLLGERLLHLGGGVPHGGDVGLDGAGRTRVFAVGRVLQFLEFVGIACGDGGVIGTGELGQRDDDRPPPKPKLRPSLVFWREGLR